jgi:regulator of nucleoside diphosphate kinase
LRKCARITAFVDAGWLRSRLPETGNGKMDQQTQQDAEAAPNIKITKRDMNRLESLLHDHAAIRSWKAVAFLVGELDRATVVADEEIEPTVVTIGARVAFRQDGRDETTVVTLALPGMRDLYPDAISILTPVGAALIGLSVGQSIAFAGPDGRGHRLTVTALLHQPQIESGKAKRGAEILQRWPVPTD